MLQKTLGQLLDLPSYHHYADLPIYFANQELVDKGEVSFVILFAGHDSPQLVTTKLATGSSPFLSDAQRFALDKLSQGLVAVPLPAVTKAEVIAIPKGLRLTPERLAQLYPRLALVRQLTTAYNPYREATAQALSADHSPSARASIDYDRDYLEELQSFATNRQQEASPVSMDFWDDKTGQSLKLYVRGWYLFEGKPPLQLSWKPRHSRKANWRTSHIFIERASGRYFFEGQVLKNKRRPVYLDELRFTSTPSQSLVKNWQTFLNQADQLKETAQLQIKNS